MSKEAMKQALEVLELAKRSYGVVLLSDPPQDAWKTRGVNGEIDKSITSLRQAIAESEKQEPVLVVEKEPDYMSGGHFHEGTKPHIDPTKVWSLPIGTKLYDHPQPKQEPVAEVEADGVMRFKPTSRKYKVGDKIYLHPQPKETT